MSGHKMFVAILIALTMGSLFGMGANGNTDVQDISALLTDSTGIRLTESSKAVLKTMESVSRLPSCNKHASAGLINSCSELEHASTVSRSNGVDAMLEKSKNIYAARLAVCELGDASASIPKECIPFSPTERTSFLSFILPGRRTIYPTYDDETARHLDACISALSRKPQTWTSYSNARQNAVVMCHAMRASVEHSERLELLKVMADVSNEAVRTMNTATDEMNEFLANFDDIKRGMHAFQVSVNKGRDEMDVAIEKHWSQLRHNVEELAGNVGAVLITARYASEQLNDYVDESIRAHQQTLKAHHSVSDLIVKVEGSSRTALDLQAEINQNMINAHEFTHRANESAHAMHAVIGSVMLRLNDTREIVEVLHRDMSALPIIQSMWDCIIALFMDDHHRKPLTRPIYLTTTAILQLLFRRWYREGGHAATFCALAASSLVVHLLPPISPPSSETFRPIIRILNSPPSMVFLLGVFGSVVSSVILGQCLNSCRRRASHTPAAVNIDAKHGEVTTCSRQKQSLVPAISLPINDPRFFAKSFPKGTDVTTTLPITEAYDDLRSSDHHA